MVNKIDAICSSWLKIAPCYWHPALNEQRIILFVLYTDWSSQPTTRRVGHHLSAHFTQKHHQVVFVYVHILLGCLIPSSTTAASRVSNREGPSRWGKFEDHGKSFLNRRRCWSWSTFLVRIDHVQQRHTVAAKGDFQKMHGNILLRLPIYQQLNMY